MKLTKPKPQVSQKLRLSLLLTLLLTTTLLVGCSDLVSNNQTGGAGSSLLPTQTQNNVGNKGTLVITPAFTPTPVAITTKGNSGSKGHLGQASFYPDPNLTPGDVFPGVTAQEVCVSGYSKSVRSVSSTEKAAVYQRYGISNTPGQHEVDHFISLELGGSNDLKNLWPEPYEPKPGAHEKDAVENALHGEVCNGRMTLSQAQSIISQDWYVYYRELNP